MSDINQLLRGLRVRNVGLSATKCFIDGESGLLSICGWSQDLTTGVDIALTIVDETDHLEWTCIMKSVLHRRTSDESFQVKILRSSIPHRFVVTAKVLRKIPDGDSVTADVECYKVTSESFCEAITSSRTNSLPSLFPVLDLRPQLREGIGISDGVGSMLHLLDSGSILPAERSTPLICTGTGTMMQIELYQGNSVSVAYNRKLHNIALSFLNMNSEKDCSLSLNVGEDGTLKATFAETNYNNVEETIVYRIVDVVCPKIAIDTTDPEFHVEWTEQAGIGKKAVLVINTTYAEIHRWRVSVAEGGVATGNAGGHVFLFPRDGWNQRFEIPANILEAGVSYEVTVEGLQLIVDSFRNFRIVCRNSGVLETFQLQASQVILDIQIQIQRSTFHQASVLISTNPGAAPANRKWKISIQKTEPVYSFYTPMKEFVEWATTGSCQRFDFPLQFQPAHRYQVTVEPLECSGGIYQNPDNSVRQTAEFRAELTLEDIKTLHRKAVGHTSGYRSLPCQWLYRNKSPRYFQDIQLNHGGIMKVYNKDNSGDPASPINLQIKGLFFMASVDNRTGQLPADSPFGSTRIRMRAEDMLGMASHLYFVDYYCMLGKAHYVTLVMTKPGSETDRFCAERLMPLSVHDASENPFLFYDQLGRLKVSAAHYLWVEILFTEDIDVHTGVLQSNVPTVGTGSSKPEGIPKNSGCQQCNLSRYTGLQQF